MALTLNALFSEMNSAGLTLRKSPTGDPEIVGDTSRISDAIRTAVQEHRGTILACLPDSPAAAPEAIQAADAIRKQLDEFAEFLLRYANWAQPTYLASIDRRMQQAIDTQDPQVLSRQIEVLRQEIEAVNWAAQILPRSFETEAKHAAEAGAGPATTSPPADADCPF